MNKSLLPQAAHNCSLCKSLLPEAVHKCLMSKSLLPEATYNCSLDKSSLPEAVGLILNKTSQNKKGELLMFDITSIGSIDRMQ